jgi:hypothetical protein
MNPAKTPARGGLQLFLAGEGRDMSKRRSLLERILPDDPNHIVVKLGFLQSWADSHGLVADAFDGKVSLSDYVEGCIRTFDQGAQIHVAFKDATSIAARCREIDRMARKSIGLFSNSLAPEAERLGKTYVEAAIGEFSHRVNGIAARSKEQMFREALDQATLDHERPISPESVEATSAAEDASVNQEFLNPADGQKSQHSPPSEVGERQLLGIPSQAKVYAPCIVQQMNFTESRHSLPAAPEEITADFRGLAHAAIVAVTRGSSVPLGQVDDWMDRLRQHGHSGESMEQLVSASKAHLVDLHRNELAVGTLEQAARFEALASKFGELLTRLSKLGAVVADPAAPAAAPAGPKATGGSRSAGMPVGSGTASDKMQSKRRKTRSAWLNEQCSKKQWSSDLEIASHGGPTYNTIRRYRSGKKSTHDACRGLRLRAHGSSGVKHFLFDRTSIAASVRCREICKTLRFPQKHSIHKAAKLGQSGPNAAGCFRRAPSQTSAIPIVMPTAEVSATAVKKVLITNPIENGSNFTSRKRALQFVEAGRAVFVGDNSIRFIETDPRNQAAQRRAAVEYNAVNRVMNKKEIANIPLVRPGKAVREYLTKRSRVPVLRHVAGRSGPVRVIERTRAIR